MQGAVSKQGTEYRDQFLMQFNQYLATQHPIVRGLHLGLKGLAMVCFILPFTFGIIAMYQTVIWVTTGSVASLGIAWANFGFSCSFMVFFWGTGRHAHAGFPHRRFPCICLWSGQEANPLHNGTGCLLRGLRDHVRRRTRCSHHPKCHLAIHPEFILNYHIPIIVDFRSLKGEYPMTTNVQKFVTDKEAREHLKAQLAEYLTQAPTATRSAHTWMKRVEAAGLGIVIAVFAVALYGCFAWASTNPTMIPIAWFSFATSLSLMVILSGLHAILIRAYPPVIFPGKVQKFVSGSTAVWIGAASIVGGLILAGVWIMFAYSTATFNLTMIVPLVNILSVVMSIAIVGSIVYSIYQKATQSR
jgi:hypothetical protein